MNRGRRILNAIVAVLAPTLLLALVFAVAGLFGVLAPYGGDEPPWFEDTTMAMWCRAIVYGSLAVVATVGLVWSTLRHVRPARKPGSDRSRRSSWSAD